MRFSLLCFMFACYKYCSFQLSHILPNVHTHIHACTTLFTFTCFPDCCCLFFLFSSFHECVHVYVCVSSCLHKWLTVRICVCKHMTKYSLVIRLKRPKKIHINVVLKEDVSTRMRGIEEERNHRRMTDEPEICNNFYAMARCYLQYSIWHSCFFSRSFFTHMNARTQWMIRGS